MILGCELLMKWIGSTLSIILLSLMSFENVSAQCQTETDDFPPIIIHEVSNGLDGRKEFVELLILGDGTQSTVDIRGYIIDDNNGEFSNLDNGISGTGIAFGHIRFTESDVWASVPRGSLIVLYNASDPNPAIAADDPTDADIDGSYILPYSHPSMEGQSSSPTTSYTAYDVDQVYGTASASYVALQNTRDAIQVRYPNGAYCHGISWGSDLFMTGGPDDLKITASSTSKKVIFLKKDFNDYELGFAEKLIVIFKVLIFNTIS